MLHQLLRHLERKRQWQLVLLLLLMLVGAAGEMATIGAVVPLLSLLSAPGDGACKLPLIPCNLDVQGALVLFASVALVAGAARILLVRFSTHLAYSIGADLGARIYGKTLHEPYSVHVKSNSSEIISDILKVDSVVANVLYPGISVVVAFVGTMAIVLALLQIDFATTALTFSVFALLYIGIYLLTQKQRKRNSDLISQFDSLRIKAIQEGLGGIRDVILDGTQRMHHDKFEYLNRRQRMALAQNSFVNQYPRYIVETAGMLFIAGAAWYYTRSGAAVGAALPVLGALALGAQKLLPQIQLMYAGVSSVRGSAGLVEDVLRRLGPAEEKSQGQWPSTTLAPTIRRPGVAGKNPILQLVSASFRYSESGPLVLNNVCVSVQRGARVGFIGRTGSGKSTLIDLLMGLLQPVDGALVFDGTAVTTGNVRVLQDRIAHVPQAIFLADASLAENIAYGVPAERIDRQKLDAAAERAQLTEFIASLPDGYDTKVGERGVRLSGGQRQRIGIARALYKEADILILDEATSALDDLTEARIMDAIHRTESSTTILMIAHRISTLAHCDYICEMEAGRIMRHATYEQVARQPGLELTN